MAIRGIRGGDGVWNCAVEKSEITFPEFPNAEYIQSLEQERHYDKTGYEYSFEEAFGKFDLSEWFLCHPAAIHPDFADVVIEKFEQRMREYIEQYPAESSMERFIRENKIKEWRTKAGKNRPDPP